VTATTIIIGAGATVAEGIRIGVDPLPPLDKGFFSRLAVARPKEFSAISGYMSAQYDIDIVDPSDDGLETVMSTIYADVRHAQLGPSAARAFRSLIRSINGELTTSVNKMKADSESYVCRLVEKEIERGVRLEDISFVTFNYDLQIEKALEALGKNGTLTADWTALNFPYCYHLPPLPVTSPTAGVDMFDVGNPDLATVAILKLHGSINWYSTHNSRNPSIDALLRTTRPIRLTRRRTPPVGMTLTQSRTTYAYPVVIPPVLNKSAILPTGFASVWKDAEQDLSQSSHVIVFGYSCPAFDLEAANLVARSLRKNDNLRVISVIDPNPDVMVRYARLCQADRIAYYRHAEAYLS
jgi:hypothetical protein